MFARKITLILVLLFALMIASVYAASTCTDSDNGRVEGIKGTTTETVKEKHYAYDSIEGFYKQGLTNGCSTNPLNFCPESATTRAAMAVFLIRTMGLESDLKSDAPMFKDVLESHWAYNHIQKMGELGITIGCGTNSDGTLNFCPEQPTSRSQAAVFIIRALKQEPDFSAYSFEDVTEASFGSGFIQKLYRLGITYGCSSSPLRYCPDDSLSRAQAVMMLSRAFNIKSYDNPTPSFNDVPKTELINSKTDNCISLSTLKEYYCSSEQKLLEVNMECKGGCENGACTSPLTPSIEVISPNGGIFMAGSSLNVSWISRNVLSDAWVGVIRLYKDNNFLVDIVPSHSRNPASGSILWAISSNSVTGDNFKVKIVLSSGQVGSETNIAEVWSNPFSIRTAPVVNLTCVDNDNGLQYEIFGSVQDYENGKQMGDSFDFCLSSSVLNERYCKDGKVTDSEVNCQYGCVDGVCKKNAGNDASTRVSCEDSDGQNYFTYGSVKHGGVISMFPTSHIEHFDVCNENTLTENYCDKGYFNTVNYQCASGCRDGSCLSEGSESPPVNTIKAVTVYMVEGRPESQALYNYLSANINKIKENGFNTVWLVSPWTNFDPQPLAQNHQYNQQAFENTKNLLQLLRQNNMRAIIGLNYLGTGWSPDFNNDGIRDESDFCDWIQNAEKYNSFERYVHKFLTEISDYSDMVYVLVFTENSEPCGMADQAHAREVAALLRPTLGSLPTRLPQNLKAFKIGYHDYTIINLGWGQGDSPIQSPNSFDFLSMVGYGLDNKKSYEITQELNSRSNRFRSLYPGVPLIIGESGASSCNNQDENQARIDVAIANYSINNNYGFNIWGWKPGPPDQECTNPVYGGLAIINQDGIPKTAAIRLKEFLGVNSPSSSRQSVLEEVTLTSEYKLNLKAGWNLFSTPVVDSENKLFSSYSSDCDFMSDLWKYSSEHKSYVKTDRIANSIDGYWIRTRNDCTVNVIGDRYFGLNEYTSKLELKRGWNVIGGSPNEIRFEDIKNNCNIVKGPYSYNPLTKTYEKSSYLEPGKGYILSVSDDCTANQNGIDESQLPSFPSSSLITGKVVCNT